MTDRAPLLEALQTDVRRPVRSDARALAENMARRHGHTVAAVLFYGSCLRNDDPAGILDFYVLVDSNRAIHGLGLTAAANAILPPHVIFLAGDGITNAGAKVAILSRRQFLARLRPNSVDTTVWARFCQPSALVYCRDDEARAWVANALADAAMAAVHWALRLGPVSGSAGDFWIALFRHTYGAELRTETADRARIIHGFAAARFDALLPLAAAPEDVALDDAGTVHSTVPPRIRAAAQAGWNRRRRLGKALNAARLIKALFTFDGGLDYLVWKLERHSKQTVTLTPWQRRHPILAAPAVLASLYRRGIIR